MNRKAALQRKLASTPAPKPPAGLADRIKSEIPEQLRFNAEHERERFASSIALNLRVAASFLVLMATAFLALRIVRDQQPAPMRAAKPAAVRATSTEAQPMPAVVSSEEPLPSPPKPVARTAQRSHRGQPPSAAPESAAAPAFSAEAQVAEAKPAAPPLPPAAAAPAPVIAPQANVIHSTASAPAVTDRAMQKTATLRIDSNDPFVQRFAAPRTVPDDVVLDVEAADEPLSPEQVVVRASIDAGKAVQDLSVDVLLSAEAKPSARWLAESFRWGTDRFKGSRSTLVEFTLPNVPADATLAMIRARYGVADEFGQVKEYSIEKVIRRSDVVAWTDASQRTKGGTLAALWMTGGADRAKIANVAREAGLDRLAAEIDARAKAAPDNR